MSSRQHFSKKIPINNSDDMSPSLKGKSKYSEKSTQKQCACRGGGKKNNDNETKCKCKSETSSEKSVCSDDKSQREKPYTMRELACNLRDAVVVVSGQSILLGCEGTNQNEGEFIITNTGNGFFIKGHYIICPADLVLMNPTNVAINKRIPDFPNENNDREQFRLLNSLVRVSKILVDVANVNGCGISYSYEADIVGIDGAANIAVLRISNNNAWNQCNPPIRPCHPFLQWGKSRSSCPGDTIMVIGNIPAPPVVGLTDNVMEVLTAENAVAIGNIADNRYVYPGGQVPGELLLLSNIFQHGSQKGLPVITTNGTVIGMVVNINTTYLQSKYHYGYNIALSEFFMRRPVKALIRSRQDSCIPNNYKNFIDPVVDPISHYYRFNKSWLGLAGILMSQADFNTDIKVDNSMNVLNLYRSPVINEHGFMINKEIVGYRILAVAGPTGVTGPTGLFIPGASPEFSPIPNLKPSPLYGLISNGDIVTHINGCPLGDRKGQISPSLVMWRIPPGDTVNLIYKKQSERFRVEHEIIVKTESYEPFLDYPFYASIPVIQTMLPTLI